MRIRLRPRRERPRRRRVAEQRDELPPPHSITSSPADQRQWHRETKHLRGLQVDDQLELRGLLDRKVGRLLALENSSGIDADLPVSVRNARSITHQAAGNDKLAILNRSRAPRDGKPMTELFVAGVEECIGADDKAARPQLAQTCKDRVKVALRACTQDMKLSARGCARPPACLSTRASALGLVGLTSSAMLLAVGTSSCSSSSRFGPSSVFKMVTPVSVAARSSEAHDNASLDRIDAGEEDDRNGRGRRSCRQCRWAVGDDHGHLTTRQIGGQGGNRS